MFYWLYFDYICWWVLVVQLFHSVSTQDQNTLKSMQKYSEVNIYKIFQFIIWLTCALLLSFFAGIKIFGNSIHLLQPWLVKQFGFNSSIC